MAPTEEMRQQRVPKGGRSDGVGGSRDLGDLEGHTDSRCEAMIKTTRRHPPLLVNKVWSDSVSACPVRRMRTDMTSSPIDAAGPAACCFQRCHWAFGTTSATISLRRLSAR